ncbi:hypothetical protein LJR194_005425 [Acidovorax sp. LjRoot194]
MKALESAIQGATSLQELKKLVADANAKNAMNQDGTIRGLVYCAPSGKRGAVLQVSIRRGTPNGFTTSMIVDGKDFRTVYREIVDAIVHHYDFAEGNELIRKMHESTDIFLKKYGLRLKEVRYEQVTKAESKSILKNRG